MDSPVLDVDGISIIMSVPACLHFPARRQAGSIVISTFDFHRPVPVTIMKVES
jgi:hypothetical protein